MLVEGLYKVKIQWYGCWPGPPDLTQRVLHHQILIKMEYHETRYTPISKEYSTNQWLDGKEMCFLNVVLFCDRVTLKKPTLTGAFVAFACHLSNAIYVLLTVVDSW